MMDKGKMVNLLLVITALLVVAAFASAVKMDGEPKRCNCFAANK